VTAVTIALTGYLFYVIPKGLFPIEDTGYITVGTETAEDTSFAGMVEKQLEIDAIIRANPYVASYNNEVGQVGARMGVNGGAFYIQLKPRGERPPVGEIIQQLRRQVSAVTGINVFFQPVQNLNIGVKSSRSLYQYTLQSGNLDELYRFAPLVAAQMRRLPALQDVGSDLQIKNPQAIVNVDRQKAAALGLTAEQIRTTLYNSFGSRQVATLYTASNDYAIILELGPSFQEDTDALSKVFVRSTAGQLVPLGTVATVSQVAGPLTVTHQGQLPAVTISFNLAPGVALGAAIDQIQDMERRLALPATITPGVAARPGLVAARDHRRHLSRAEHSLRELPSPDHDPFGAAGSRCRRPADAHAVPDGPQRDRDHRSDHAGRHRQEECDHDDRLRPRRAA
jgi:HAE1 family hydrophobic/amphiphilic exporter-1